MGTSEHRITPRLNLRTRLSFHRTESSTGGEYQARAINISRRGVYFVTNVALSVGEALEVLLEMPKSVTGAKEGIRRFTARVAHIESKNMLPGICGIGVHLLYYERDLAKVMPGA
jgi:hypothetical protein